jgi:hypothetical protein
MSNHNGRGRGIFWGLLLLVVGVLIILHNLGYISGSIWRWWPIILIVVGLKKLIY